MGTYIRYSSSVDQNHVCWRLYLTLWTALNKQQCMRVTYIGGTGSNLGNHWLSWQFFLKVCLSLSWNCRNTFLKRTMTNQLQIFPCSTLITIMSCYSAMYTNVLDRAFKYITHIRNLSTRHNLFSPSYFNHDQVYPALYSFLYLVN